VAVCPIHLNPDTGLIEQSTDHETLREEMQKNEGCQLPVLEYSDHNLAEQIIDMNAQTVMVADELLFG
jgi:predicted double-glycine peptidase